eukprot:TRINITY_DN22532_c0_g1_i1.p1 TRINITY_DN22532_c0_g1~~TRINITY_DN22532_c0_g1_i1.p1  ORF type:complete len:188 (+),score=19.77 TRINITY_DN22532_c0_g1_i1:43-606(+)
MIDRAYLWISTDKHSCDGVYEKTDMEVGGYPVWKKSNGNRWIYSGGGCRWVINDMLKGIREGEGFIVSEVHEGRPPDCSEEWSYADGRGGWAHDITFSVTLYEGQSRHLSPTRSVDRACRVGFTPSVVTPAPPALAPPVIRVSYHAFVYAIVFIFTCTVTSCFVTFLDACEPNGRFVVRPEYRVMES